MPIDTTTIKTLYVFVEIAIDARHLAETIRMNIPDDRQSLSTTINYLDDQVSQVPAGTLLGSSNHLRICASANEQNCPGSVPCARQPTRLALVSTIQFAAALQQLKDDLVKDYQDTHNPLNSVENVTDINAFPHSRKYIWMRPYAPVVPRSKPLSPGEILGCTAPLVKDVDALMSVSTLFVQFSLLNASQMKILR